MEKPILVVVVNLLAIAIVRTGWYICRHPQVTKKTSAVVGVIDAVVVLVTLGIDVLFIGGRL